MRYVSTYLTSTQRDEFPVVKAMTDSGRYSPEVCEWVYMVLKDYATQESGNGESFDTEHRQSLLYDLADSITANIPATGLYKHAEEADEYFSDALQERDIETGYFTLADVIAAGLSELIYRKAESHFTGGDEE